MKGTILCGVLVAICAISVSAYVAPLAATRPQWMIWLTDLTAQTQAPGYCVVRYNSTYDSISWDCHFKVNVVVTSLTINQGTLPQTGSVVYTESGSLSSPWIGSWTPLDKSIINSLFTSGLYWSVNTAARDAYIVGQASSNGKTTVGAVTSTFDYAAEFTSSQVVPITTGIQVNTNLTGGVMLIALSGTTQARFYCVHNVVNPTSITLYVGDPGSFESSVLLQLCTGADCSSPYTSGLVSLTGTYLTGTVASWLKATTTGSAIYGQVFINIGTADFPDPENAATRAQVGTSRTVVNPYKATSSSSSSSTGGKIAAASPMASLSPVAIIIATIVSIVAAFRA